MFDLHHPIIDAEVILTSHHSVHSVVGRACAFLNLFIFSKKSIRHLLHFLSGNVKAVVMHV